MRLVAGVGINDLYNWCNYNIHGKTGLKYRTYVLWKSMITRCYSSEYQSRNPYYIGCSVCDEWLRFSNFAKDIVRVEGYEMWRDNPNQFIALDKDTKVKGNKVYSPETCCFLSIADSVADANRRRAPEYNRGFKFPFGIRGIEEIFSDGSSVYYPSSGAAARVLGLTPRNIRACCEGRQKTHKGHKFRYAEAVS